MDYQFLKKYFLKMGIPLIIVVALILTGIYFIGNNSETNLETLIRIGHGIIMTGGIWVGCVIIVNFLWHKYPWQLYPGKHLILELLLILIYTVGYASLIYKLETKLFNYQAETNLLMDAFTTILITYFITSIHEAYYFYRQWKYNFSRSVKLKKDSIEANYEALKNQINPHFLFNSLNSLTSMVDENETAVKYISDLSDFLRYLLTTNEKDLVSLEDELNITEKYLNLQKNRFREALTVEINIDKEALNLVLPPLALQMLVENTIKHNIISEKNTLNIRIFTERSFLCIENNLNRKKSVFSTGKGLVNIRNRYALFSGEQMQIHESPDSYLVKIPLLSVEK